MLSRSDKANSAPSLAAPFAIQRSELDRRTSVISVAGELDLSTSPQLKWMLHDALQEGRSRLIVDLSLATFMDSTALGVLVGVNRSLDVGARLAIVCARASLLKIFELSGLEGVFTIYATLEDALARTSGRAAEAS
jgi:anti-sigma B factor antagonist